MKLDLFHRLRPICPACRLAGREAPHLEIARAIREEAGDLIEGALVCPERRCRREHPVLDGIPILLADVRGFVAGQLGEIRAREDLDPVTENLLGDCAGPGSDLDRHRYQVSSYARDHYGDLDPDQPADTAGDLLGLFGAALELLGAGGLAAADVATGAAAGERPGVGAATAGQMTGSNDDGVWLDLGCSVGRTTFELAERLDRQVLGVDLSFPMLRVARRAAREGRIRHPLRRSGIVYARRDFSADLPGRERVDFWIADAAALPFAPGAAAGVLALNLLDCTLSPLSLLAELGRVLAPGAGAALATPYDWSTGATPLEGWLGGHSERGDGRGDPAREPRRLLAPGDPAEVRLGLELVRERDRVPWRVYVHERAAMHYQVHLAALRRAA